MTRLVVRNVVKVLIITLITLSQGYWVSDVYSQAPEREFQRYRQSSPKNPKRLNRQRQKTIGRLHKNLNSNKQLLGRKLRHRSISRYNSKPSKTRHNNVTNRATLRNTKPQHRSLENKSQRDFKPVHRSLESHSPQNTKVNHRSLSNYNSSPFKTQHRSLESKEQRWQKIAHRSLSNQNPKGFKITHRDLEKGPFSRLARKRFRPESKSGIRNMRYACYPGLKIRHKDLVEVCYPIRKIRHKDLSENCLPQYKTRHKDLSASCYPQLKVKHKDLQSKCYPTPKVKHRNLSLECLPQYRVAHRDLNGVCYKPVKIKHRDLSDVCYPRIVIRHQNMNDYSCTEYHIPHTPMDRYRVFCDPNIQKPTTVMERVGKELNYWFTRHKRFCKLEARYSGVTVGCVVETTHGTAVVTDLEVKKDIYYPTRMMVDVALPRRDDGEPRTKTFKLSKEETKEVQIRELIKRHKFVWLVRMYPEERKNLDRLKELYLDPNADKGPPDNPMPVDDN